MNLRLYNSLTRRLEDFVPQDPNRVTMYLCGPTVYNYVHIGNARGPVVFGLLARLLRRIYGADHVVYLRNITDVDDKINIAARDAGVPINTITQRYIAAYREDMTKLGADVPDLEPQATQHIPQIIALCERLIATAHAYATTGHVLFNVGAFPQYGQLSGRSIDEMIAGARVEVAPYKKHPADFVLWKPSTPDLPGWDSPWGRGRPGWHIECSAMSAAHLGETLDIHAGGNDLLFPHHENEVAQSTCAHGGKLFARYWLHNGMLSVEGRKMSKSLGNTLVLRELLQKYSPEVLRYLLIKAHYRQPLDWSQATLEQVISTLDRLYGTLRGLSDVVVDSSTVELPKEFEATLIDDLNTPEALAALARLAETARKAKNTQDKKAAKVALLSAGAFLGLLQQDPETWFKTGSPTLSAHAQTCGYGEDFKQKIEALIAERTAARLAKDFRRADMIRKELANIGVAIEDGAQGTRWNLVKSNECAT